MIIMCANKEDLTESDIRELICENCPEKTLVDITEHENEEHQTYKFLYDRLEKEYEQTREQMEKSEHERKQAVMENDALRSLKEKIESHTQDYLEFIKCFSKKNIIVSDMKVYDSKREEIVMPGDNGKRKMSRLSDRPGVYGFERPSWFTPLKTELTRKNIIKRNAASFQKVMQEKISFWKKLSGKLKSGVSAESLSVVVDEHRKEQIRELLCDNDISNEEKYLKYILLTPGLPRDYLKTLIGASELEIDANTVIELLEQPEESFNKEIIEIYVSKVYKATEYNTKRELAQELLKGEWYITAEINGVRQNFQLMPGEWIEQIKTELEEISTVLSMKDSTIREEKQLCASMAQSVKEIIDSGK